MWQPDNWVQLLKPIVDFFHQVLMRFGCNTPEQLSELQASLTSLQQAANAFSQLQRCPGDQGIFNALSSLDRSSPNGMSTCLCACRLCLSAALQSRLLLPEQDVQCLQPANYTVNDVPSRYFPLHQATSHCMLLAMKSASESCCMQAVDQEAS